MDLYLLPGLGADHRLFSRLDLGGITVRHLAWPRFEPGITLPAIAAQLSAQVDRDRPHILAGVSMGGMVALELAAMTQPSRVVLISSWTGPHEWPRRVRLAALMGLHRTITGPTMQLTWPLKRALLRQRDAEVDRLLHGMALDQGARNIRLGTDALLRWKGSSWHGPVTRLHGDLDAIIPLRFKVDHVVRGARHVMVLDRAAEVSAILRSILALERT